MVRLIILGINEIARLQFENMFAHYQLQVDFLEKLIVQLDKMGDQPSDTLSEGFQKYFE
ncbi:hypothetical protein [Cytobacillus sp.]|uniref:hypothetical protein n=1 Tax=Cytobacillus sp. TaxID=2675269 RepID=UPI0028BEE48E|nr:hypothetical protein [Cytobacillus sp.]